MLGCARARAQSALLTAAAESCRQPWRQVPLHLRQGIAHCAKRSPPHHTRYKLSGDVRRRQVVALSTSGGPTGNDGEGTGASESKTRDAGSTDAEGSGATPPAGHERAGTHAAGPADWEQMAARMREAWDGEVGDEELPEPGAGEEYDEREMALQSMLYPSMVPTNEELLDQSHVPVIQDPWQNKGRFYRCRGKRQGKGALEGTCEIFNVKELHVNNTVLLKSFLNEASAILPRRRTGLCAKCQRKVSATVKKSRHLGLLPIVDDFEVRDTGPGGLKAWAVGGRDRETPEQRAARLQPKLKRFGSLA